MARPKKQLTDAEAVKMRDVEAYTHDDKKRTNNPPVGMAQHDKAEEKVKTYQFDPHLDPTLQWAGKPLYNYVRGNNESLDSKYRSDLLDIYRRLNDACLTHLQKWRILDAQMAKFFDSRFYLYERVLRNTMRAPNKSLSEKMRWNNAFLRSTEFREALEARECFVHPLYLRAYKSGSYRMVLFLNHLHKWKSKFLK